MYICTYECIHFYKTMCDLQEPRIKVFYSTPSRYLDAVYQTGLSWTVKEDDFFPYASGPWAYWTGKGLHDTTQRDTLRISNRLPYNGKIMLCIIILCAITIRSEV